MLDIANAVRELARQFHDPTEAHWNDMCECINCVGSTPVMGLLLKPTGNWGKDKNFKFKIRGRSDSNYATDPESKRSIMAIAAYLNDAPITFIVMTKSQKHAPLSVI